MQINGQTRCQQHCLLKELLNLPPQCEKVLLHSLNQKMCENIMRIASIKCTKYKHINN